MLCIWIPLRGVLMHHVQPVLAHGKVQPGQTCASVTPNRCSPMDDLGPSCICYDGPQCSMRWPKPCNVLRL